MVHLGLQPSGDLAVGAFSYRHDFDKPQTGDGTTSKSRYREENVYAEWDRPLEGVSLAGLLGTGKAGGGRKQELGTSGEKRRTSGRW